MPVTKTRYGANLFSLNALGNIWLDQTVTTTNFRGPPIVLVNTTIDETDPAIQAAVDFAAIWNAPLVAFDRSVSYNSWALSTLASACVQGGKICNMTRHRKFDLPVGTVTKTLAISGPWIVFELGGPPVDAWTALSTNNFARTGQNHPYVCGMQGVSHFVDGVFAPPLYRIGFDVITGLDRLKKKWDGSAIASVSQYADLAVAAAIRPGLARLCNPALLPELVVVPP